MTYKILENRIKLIGSYAVPKADFEYELQKIRCSRPSSPLWGRQTRSLLREWAAHNLAYSLGIRREKTADCDLNYVQPWYLNVLYAVVGTIALWVIR